LVVAEALDLDEPVAPLMLLDVREKGGLFFLDASCLFTLFPEGKSETNQSTVK